MAYSTAIGDSQPVAYTVPACALPFPVVEEADLVVLLILSTTLTSPVREKVLVLL